MVVITAHGLPGLPQVVVTKMGMALDVFFLISGFLFVVITDEKSRPARFFIDRVLRIVPLYWLLTLFSFFLIYSGVLAGILNPVRLALGVIAGDWSFLFQSLLFFPGPSPFEPDLNPLIPQGWTLNYEMMFYVLFAASLWLPRKFVVPANTAMAATIVLMGVSLDGGPAFRFWTSPIIFEFVFGLWVGVAWQRMWDFRLLFLGLFIAWVPIAVVSVLYFADWPFSPDRIASPFGLILVLALFVFLVALDRRGDGLPEFKPMRLIGDAGYSIYLFHFIPIVLADCLDDVMVVPAAAYFLIVVGGGFAGGFACYFWIERPIARYLRKLRTRRPFVRAQPVGAAA